MKLVYIGRMAKTVISVLALSVFVAQCHVLERKGSKSNENHMREKRSCHVCDNNDSGPSGPPAPPPPPPFGLQSPPPPPPSPPVPLLRTQNWSGLTRSSDGSQHGIFSGAAASADLGSQTVGQAYSLASSSANDGASTGLGLGGGSGASSGAKSGAFGGGADFGGASGGIGDRPADSEGQYQTKDFAGVKAGQSGNGFDGHNNHYTASGSYKDPHFSLHGSRGQFEGHGGGATVHHTGGFGAGTGPNGFSGQGGSGSSAQAYGTASAGEQQELQSSHGGLGVGSANLQSGLAGAQLQKGYGSERQSEASPDGEGPTGGSGREALSGALDLASQGLQASQHPGCSTCGKSNYALSNAKSRSGNAIAVSVGG